LEELSPEETPVPPAELPPLELLVLLVPPVLFVPPPAAVELLLFEAPPLGLPAFELPPLFAGCCGVVSVGGAAEAGAATVTPTDALLSVCFASDAVTVIVAEPGETPVTVSTPPPKLACATDELDEETDTDVW
jgi:hypothetical protein